MAEYTVTLTKPGEPDQTETVFVEDTAVNMAERWEQRGEGFKAEVRDPQGNVVTREYV
jgi:hypothetical protein